MNVKKLSLSVAAALAILSAPAYAITEGESKITEAVAPEYVISGTDKAQVNAYYSEHKADSYTDLVTGMIAAFPQIPTEQIVAALLDFIPELPSTDYKIEQDILSAAMTSSVADAPAIAVAALNAGIPAEIITTVAVDVQNVNIAAVAVAMETYSASGDAAPGAGDTTRATFSGRGSGVSASN